MFCQEFFSDATNTSLKLYASYSEKLEKNKFPPKKKLEQK